MSVKQYVMNCLDKGMSDMEAWRAARDQYYPLRIVGWGYICKIAKEYRAASPSTRSRK